jgi:hypothetical protein
MKHIRRFPSADIDHMIVKIGQNNVTSYVNRDNKIVIQ